MGQPDLNAFFDQLCSRYGWDWGALTINPGLASGIVFGTNPPFTIADFLSFYPKFGGSPLLLTGTITAGSPTVTGTGTAGLLPGQVVAAFVPLNGNLLPGSFPDGTTVLSIGTGTITLSAPALIDGTQVAIYNAPFVPLVALTAYVTLASASLQQARWKSQWNLAMCDYIAHFCTLYLRSDGDVYSSAGQAAAAGLSRGITVSKSAGGVSMAMQLSTQGGLEEWGAWQETTYGARLITFARIIGMGPIWVP